MAGRDWVVEQLADMLCLSEYEDWRPVMSGPLGRAEVDDEWEKVNIEILPHLTQSPPAAPLQCRSAEPQY